MRNLFAAVVLMAAAAGAQPQLLTPGLNPLVARYQANYTATLSSAASTVTVQGAGIGGGEAYFEEADVYCSVACTITVSINGTAATATSLAVTAQSTANVAVPLTAWSGSNVGVGTALKSFTIAAGALQVLDMTAFYFPAGASTATNITIATSSITGTARIQIQWRAK